MPVNIASHLSANLLWQDAAAGGLLRVALPPPLQVALEEAFIFLRQRLGVPPAVSELMQERPRLRGLRVGAVQVCRAYNAVLGSLSAEDRRLCRDRIRWESSGNFILLVEVASDGRQACPCRGRLTTTPTSPCTPPPARARGTRTVRRPHSSALAPSHSGSWTAACCLA